MGYYTNFSLRICSNEEGHLNPFFKMDRIDELMECLDDLGVFEDEYFETTDNGILLERYGYAKWYHWEEDMVGLSKKFPEVVFALAGTGEDAEDLWKAYFCEGLEQYTRGIIQYEEFQEDKLKPRTCEK